jgi:phosphoglucomutase
MELEFGTGGLRGIMGEGNDHINIETIREATQGLANFIIKEGGQKKGVAIAYDSRNHSQEFAEETARCLVANDIKAYIFNSLRPTPVLSFAVRELGCQAGVVITASHNPPEYNGYKVYWADGAQITYPKDEQIIAEVNAVGSSENVKTISYKEALYSGRYIILEVQIDDSYMEELHKLVLHPEVIKRQAKSLKIVYSPLHGSGNAPVQRILKELGFTQVYVVKEQEKPNGNFPTIKSPNPEDKAAFKLALELANEVGADIVLATDPDADRLGVYAKDVRTGEYLSFTGNMSGMIILEYQLSQKKAKGILPKNGAVVTTIVSGKMSHDITKAYDVALIETLTGFKYIGEQIKKFEEEKSNEFLFGYEESYGCLLGTYARDKDAVVAVMALCEAAAYYKEQGLTLPEQMDYLYSTYGDYREDLFTETLKGEDGAKKIEAILTQIRRNPPKEIGGFRVVDFRDYADGAKYGFVVNSKVLYFELEDGAWCCVRPSGTEPKIKFYIGAKGQDVLDRLKVAVKKWIK